MSAEQQEQKQIIIERLKEDGCRITKQRLMLLDIILEDECSSCKEIYYRASKKGPVNRCSHSISYDQYVRRYRCNQSEKYVQNQCIIRRRSAYKKYVGLLFYTF